jgi:hypothetical protein
MKKTKTNHQRFSGIDVVHSFLTETNSIHVLPLLLLLWYAVVGGGWSEKRENVDPMRKRDVFLVVRWWKSEMHSTYVHGFLVMRCEK